MLRRLFSAMIAPAVLLASISGHAMAADCFPASEYGSGTVQTVCNEPIGRQFFYEQLTAPSRALYDAIADSRFASGPQIASVMADLSDIPAEERTVTSRFRFQTAPDQKTYWDTEDGRLVYDTYIAPALAALAFDHPELVWLDGTQALWTWTTDYVPAMNGDEQTFALTSLTYGMGESGFAQATIDCEAADGPDRYDCADTQDLRALNAALTRAQLEIGSLDGCPNSEILRTVHDWLCRNARYADKTDGRFLFGWRGYQTAYSALVQGVTVCSGYAKAFKLLSEAYGIPCVIVEGTSMGQEHMWNYVLLGGAWYGVDMTWDDLDGGDVEETYEFFLRGAEDFGDHVEGYAWDRLPFTYPSLNPGSHPDSQVDTVVPQRFEMQTVDSNEMELAAMLPDGQRTQFQPEARPAMPEPAAGSGFEMQHTGSGGVLRGAQFGTKAAEVLSAFSVPYVLSAGGPAACGS